MGKRDGGTVARVGRIPGAQGSGLAEEVMGMSQGDVLNLHIPQISQVASKSC